MCIRDRLNSTEHYRCGFDFFKKWRQNNKTTPTHLVVFKYLGDNSFNWGDLRNSSIEIQPHYHMNELNKLYDMDMSIIGIALSQLEAENRIHFYILEMAKNAISRQLNQKLEHRVTKLRYANWSNTFRKIYKSLENQKQIEMPKRNSEKFYNYFNEEE